MKGEAQFDAYAAFYDLLYKDKDYKGEAAYINQLITRFFAGDPKKGSLLDLACGTGKHLRQLADLGYQSLAGSDIAKAMIDVAVDKQKGQAKPIDYFNYSFQESNKINRTFDIVISMFSAVNYITTYEDQSKTLKNVHGLLKKDGLFLFDYWNGCAVTEIYSPVKVLRKKQENAEILRISETTLDPIDQHVTVKFTCNYFKGDERKAAFEETHHLHYYYFSEMRNLLASHGFEILYVGPFMEMDRPVKTLDWNISIVCRKISA